MRLTEHTPEGKAFPSDIGTISLSTTQMMSIALIDPS